MSNNDNDIPIDPDLKKMLEQIDDEPEVKPESEPEAEAESVKEEPVPPSTLDPADLANVLSNFNNTKNSIEQGFADDRIKIQEYLDMIVANGKTKEFKNAHFESIASLMATKAMTTANRVRVLDSLAKILAATKNYEQNKGGSIDLGDLKDILSNDAGDEP
jgi:hypothetical protein